VTLYAYGLEALILFAAAGAARGWRALRWRPSALFAAATVAAGIGMNGGLWRIFHVPPAFPANALGRAARGRLTSVRAIPPLPRSSAHPDPLDPEDEAGAWVPPALVIMGERPWGGGKANPKNPAPPTRADA
jgi:hypothetical protein